MPRDPDWRKHLAEALQRRGLTWGAGNAAARKKLREELKTAHWKYAWLGRAWESSRRRTHIGTGCYRTNISPK